MLQNRKLHNVMEMILIKAQIPLTAVEIANRINTGKLYLRKDETNVSSSQITSRAISYSRLFKVNEDWISLVHWKSKKG
ncbi:MAG: hypothetical protein CML05_05230 [Pseudozobellia sp.]|nr:hypothetical protein [Pseudozobellia sp.]|tara:strand:- start:19 stop:255 length:237 start_codon:yes stop_codon:yes gene_type:complete